ncbi:MAG: flavodoxin family protein [Gammaproteobacteria bacterium]|nr:flavodoxin family protein [Gammaproteobacteria bacterium]
MKKRKLLIVAHTPSNNTRALADAIAAGAGDAAIEAVDVTISSPFDCDAEDVLASDGIILFTTENFGYMSGALKDFFERIYYPCLDQPQRNEGKAFALVIRAGMDGTGTDIAVHKITSGLKWREVQDTTLCKGEYRESFALQCRELGLTIAAGLDNGIF